MPLKAFKKIDNKTLALITNISFIFMALRIFVYFLVFFQSKFNLDSPLIPFDVVCMTYEPYAIRGLVLSFGLIIGLVFITLNKIQACVVNNVIWIIASSLIYYNL